MSLRAVFIGTAQFAVPSLRALAQTHEVALVVTQPDRPRGRGRTLAPPPVKVAAIDLGLPVIQPEKIRRRSVREQLMSQRPDVVVVAAYGQVIGPRLLAAPPMGCINVHASLLPRLRGAAPIQWAVLRGDQRSGVTIMRMDSGVDTGPTLVSAAIDLDPRETAGSLHDRLAPLGASLLLTALEGLASGNLQASPQDDQLATEAPMLSKDDGRVDFARPARQVDCWIRGMDPWPGAFTELDGERVRIFRSSTGEGDGEPGEVLGADQRGLLVACGDGAVWIGELQLPGKRRMASSSLLAGRPIPRGTILGSPAQEG